MLSLLHLKGRNQTSPGGEQGCSEGEAAHPQAAGGDRADPPDHHETAGKAEICRRKQTGECSAQKLESSLFSHAAGSVYRNGKLLDWTCHLGVLFAWNGLSPLSQQFIFSFFRAWLKEMPLEKLQNVLNAQ